MQLAMEGIFNCLVVMKNGKIRLYFFREVVGNNKTIGAASGNTTESNIKKVNLDHELVKTARSIGICFRRLRFVNNSIYFEINY